MAENESTSGSADDRPQARPEPRPFSREELRRHGLPADWNERIRTGTAEIRGVTYGRRR